jgi:hypothetical protein
MQSGAIIALPISIGISTVKLAFLELAVGLFEWRLVVMHSSDSFRSFQMRIGSLDDHIYMNPPVSAAGTGFGHGPC